MPIAQAFAKADFTPNFRNRLDDLTMLYARLSLTDAKIEVGASVPFISLTII